MLLDQPKTQSYNYVIPTKVNSGPGAIASISHEVSLLGCKRALLLTDPGVRAAGLTDMAQKALGDCCVGVFDRIPQDTGLDTIDAAAEVGRELEADLIVSVGGGSVIDTGKWLSVLLREGGKATDHYAFFRLTRPAIPHIVIPTTSGTGSEVTSAAVVRHHVLERKVFISDPYIYPRVAILDPAFVTSLPAGLTATTAMDALTHACEAMMSIQANLVCDGHSLQAIRLMAKHLPSVIKDGKNIEARSAVQTAAMLAGMSFSVAGIGLAHAMAHTIGALHNVPHGAACGILLPKVMRFNAEYATDALAQIAEAFGVDVSGKSQLESALAAADAVEALMQEVGAPMRMRDVGVPEEDLLNCAFHAMVDPSCIFNPRPVGDPNEVFEVYQQAF